MLILNSSLLDLEELLIAKTPIRSRIVSTSFWYLAKNPVFKISFEGQGIGTPQFQTGRNPKIFEINSHMIFSRRRWNLILKLSSQFKNTICHDAISIRTFTSFGSTPTFTTIPTYYEKVPSAGSCSQIRVKSGFQRVHSFISLPLNNTKTNFQISLNT